MGYNAGDRILETTTSTGTGNISLAGAVTGYRTFASIATADGDQFPYVIAGSSEWEVGIGTRVSSTSFSRSPTASSNAGALVSFSAGTKEVWIDWTNEHVKSLAAKNLIINGGMEVSQEKVATAQTGIVAITYIVDMFLYNLSGAAVVTLQQVADAPSGFKYSSKLSVTTADASIGATDTYILQTNVEGYKCARLGFGAAGASSISLGFWVKTHRTGIYVCGVRNQAFDRSYVVEFTVNSADTWEYKTITIPGDTTGTWATDNTVGLNITWSLATGVNKQTTAGAWQAGSFTGTANQVNGVGATTDTFQITGVSLIPGVVPVTADQSPHAVRPFDEELTLCQRYYEKSFDYATAPVQNAGVNTAETTMPSPVATGTARLPWVAHRVRKRAAPTFTIYNPQAANAQVRNNSTATDCSASSSVPWEAGHWVFATVPASSTAGDRLNYHWVADARL
jgi:hypothetical protein